MKLLLPLLPVEKLTLLVFGLCLALTLFGEVNWYFPAGESLGFATYHYLGPLFALISAALGTHFVARICLHKAANPLPNLLTYGRWILVMTIGVFLHFNLKLWAPLINPTQYDSTYATIDNNFHGIIDWINGIYTNLPSAFWGMDHPYHAIYVLMFFVSFIVHGSRESRAGEAVITGTVMVLLFGGLAYMLAPALGPFIYSGAPQENQKVMWEFNREFVGTHGAFYQPRFFIAGLAAMPSLHVAHAVMFVLFAWYDVRWLAYLYILPLLYLLFAAVALQWHYLIDLPVGALLGWLCFKLAKCVVADSVENPYTSLHVITSNTASRPQG